MRYSLQDKLVVAVASSVLFNVTESDKVFTSKGESAYREYQRDNETIVLEKEIAYPLIKRAGDRIKCIPIANNPPRRSRFIY